MMMQRRGMPCLLPPLLPPLPVGCCLLLLPPGATLPLLRLRYCGACVAEACGDREREQGRFF